MNVEKVFTSPPPSTGWVLDSEMAAVVHRTKSGEFHCAAEDIPNDGFEVGPVGLQTVEPGVVSPVLARLKGAAEGTQTAAVIVPSGWLRSFMIDIDRLPRRQNELHDVVRWRLKKLLPIAPSELRLAVVRLPEDGGQRRLLVTTGIERAMAGIEASFASVGVEVGLITSRLFALVPGAAGMSRPTLVIQIERAFLSLLLLKAGVPLFLRMKPLASSVDTASTVLREVAMTLGYIRESKQIDGELEVRLSCEALDIANSLRGWLAEQERLTPGAETARPACGPTTVVSRLGAARLEPALAVVSGSVR
jgi:hypothetical protein